jgi:hypothetical protein
MLYAVWDRKFSKIDFNIGIGWTPECLHGQVGYQNDELDFRFKIRARLCRDLMHSYRKGYPQRFPQRLLFSGNWVTDMPGKSVRSPMSRLVTPKLMRALPSHQYIPVLCVAQSCCKSPRKSLRLKRRVLGDVLLHFLAELASASIPYR